jgi:aminocarboxymuconate-semialdehyde decarboxylase
VEEIMGSRRQFLNGLAGGAAGLLFVGCNCLQAAPSPFQPGGTPKRRDVRVGGKRVLTVDVHAHCYVPEVWDLIKDYDWNAPVREHLFDRSTARVVTTANVDDRMRLMDEQGVDVQALGINPFWYTVDQPLVREIIKIQNEKMASFCARYPERFVGLATVALQYPYLAAEQLEEGMKKLGLRGALVGGSVNGEELSNPKFNPFWAKAEELGAFIFLHPQGFAEGGRRFRGNGWFSNVVGHPLETTVALAHLIFDGTLDRFPKLKICAAHGGGYLPSYMNRSDACVEIFPENCKPVKKKPSDYLRQLYFDSILFTAEGLRHMVAEVGASQVLLGSDFPFEWSRNPVDHIFSLSSLTDKEREAILGATAAKLLHLENS